MRAIIALSMIVLFSPYVTGEVLWEYNSNIGQQVRTSFHSEQIFAQADRPLRRLAYHPTSYMPNGYEIRTAKTANYGQHILADGRMRFTQSLHRKSRNSDEVAGVTTAVNWEKYLPYSQSFQCLIQPIGDKFGPDKFRLPGAGVYMVEFEMEIIDCYPSGWDDEDKWWTSVDTQNPILNDRTGYVYVFELWQGSQNNAPLVVCIDTSSTGDPFFWCVQRKHENNTQIDLSNRNATSFEQNAKLTGPGKYCFKILTNMQPTNNIGYTHIQMKKDGGEYKTIFTVSGDKTFYPHDFKPTPNGNEIGYPLPNFGIYASYSKHHQLMKICDHDNDGIPNAADVDCNPGTSDYDGDNIHDMADADADGDGNLEGVNGANPAIDHEFKAGSGARIAYQSHRNSGLKDHRALGIDDRWASAISDTDGDGVPDFADADFASSANSNIKPKYVSPPNAVDIEGDFVFHEQIQLIFDDIKIQKLTPIPGDADLDGQVIFADFLVVSENFGESGTWFEGDFDNDGEIGFADFLILAANFGGTQTAAELAAMLGQ